MIESAATVAPGPALTGPDVAAWVAGHTIPVAEVDAREEALRNGRFAARLPAPHSPQGRNVRRWVTQLLATEQLIRLEARRRGLAAPTTAGPALDVAAAMVQGGVVATVLATMPLACAVRAEITATVTIDPAEIENYYHRNLDQFTVPETRLLDQLVDGQPVPWARVVAGELPAEWERALFSARIGEPVAVGRTRILSVREISPARVRPFEGVRRDVSDRLREAECDRRFGSWIQAQHDRHVQLAHGFEHPGDPTHPDATHRH